MNSKSNSYSTVSSARMLVFWNGFPTKICSGILNLSSFSVLTLDLILCCRDWDCVAGLCYLI